MPEFGAPIETFLPLRSSILVIPLDLSATTCVKFEYSVPSARSGSCSPSNESLPSTASIAVSASEKATSESPSATRKRLSTEALVVSAVVGWPFAENISATPPP